MEAKASAGEARGLGEDNDRDLLVFTPVHMDWAADRHFAEFSLDFTLLKICHSSGGKRVSIRRGGGKCDSMGGGSASLMTGGNALL